MVLPVRVSLPIAFPDPVVKSDLEALLVPINHGPRGFFLPMLPMLPSFFFWAVSGDLCLIAENMSLCYLVVMLLFVNQMYHRRSKFSMSVVDAIDYQLDLLGYITETMCV
jgi:hypothetical protein